MNQYLLTRYIDGKPYCEPEYHDTIEVALESVQNSIAHSCHCHVAELAPLKYTVDLHNQSINIRISNNQYYEITPVITSKESAL